MKEKEFINIIKETLNSKYIGDDCAYLKDLGIVITQDNLVEDVHFSLKFMTPYQLGWKSAMVNISDICASGAEPKYITVGLSLPKNTTNEFIKEFYDGLKSACKDVEIVGGDITGSDKIFISITAIGSTDGRKISSRSNAKPGQKIIVSGLHGSSGAGLEILLQGDKEPEKFIQSHLMPAAQHEFSEKIAVSMAERNEDYAMMDTSDGLADALSQIASASGVLLEVDFDKIPFDSDLASFENYRDLILYGGEDYGLIAVVPKDFVGDFTVIGEVKKGNGIKIVYPEKTEFLSKDEVEKNLYNHFADGSRRES